MGMPEDTFVDSMEPQPSIVSGFSPVAEGAKVSEHFLTSPVEDPRLGVRFSLKLLQINQSGSALEHCALSHSSGL